MYISFLLSNECVNTLEDGENSTSLRRKSTDLQISVRVQKWILHLKANHVFNT